MRGLLRHPLAFLVVFAMTIFAGDRLLAKMLESLIDSSQFRFSRLYGGKADADVVIFGDSRAVHSFYAPGLSESFKRNVVNMGYNGFTTEMVECLINDYLNNCPPPKLIVLEVTNVFHSPDSLVNVKPYLSRSPMLSELFRRERPDDYFYTQVSHLYRLNCELTLRVLYFLKKTDQTWILTRPMPPGMAQARMTTTAESSEKESPVLDKNLAAFDRILELTRKKGIELRCVVAPYWPDYYANSPAKQRTIKELQKRVRESSAGSAAAANLWDYSTLLDQSELFADRVHTNRDGARQFQQRLEVDGVFDAGASPPAGRAETTAE